MDILILVAAVLLIGLFCYKNVPTLIGGIVCSVILMIIYKMKSSTVCLTPTWAVLSAS